MAGIDIFSLEPTKISADLKGKFILLYGEAKVGKTSFASLFPKNLLCAFEVGYHALPGIKAVDINKWTDFKRVCSQLKRPEAREMYDTITIDTAQIAYTLCEKYIVQQNNVDSIRDVAWGQGWTMLKNEFAETFRELTTYGYGLVFIAHAAKKNTTALDEAGKAIEAVAPDLVSAAYNIVNRLVDIIGYISSEQSPETGEFQRFLYTRQTPSIFAGSRYKYLKTKIPFGYDSLVKSIAEAIQEQVDRDGAQVSNSTSLAIEDTSSFADVMGEAKSLWSRLVGEDPENGKRMNEIVKKVFGQEMKLSQATDNQKDLVELVIDEFKRLLK